MRIYAEPSWRLARQIAADAFVVVWTFTWWQIGRLADATIRRLADPTRSGGDLVDRLHDQVAEVAGLAGAIPIVGSSLRQPLDDVSASIAELAGKAHGQAAAFETLASQAGWLVFLAPVLVLVALWLPPRIRFALRARATLQVAKLPYGHDLLALRALAGHPLDGLTGVADDPVAAWRANDRQVIDRLAELELVRAGVLRSPAGVRPPRGQPQATG